MSMSTILGGVRELSKCFLLLHSLIKQNKIQSLTIGLPHSTDPSLILFLVALSARLGSDKYK